MQEDAREVAKATGVDFGDDAVGAIMKKYDTNGDGVFQVNEYAAPPRRRKRPLRYPPPLRAAGFPHARLRLLRRQRAQADVLP